jgi:hypothetical protein
MVFVSVSKGIIQIKNTMLIVVLIGPDSLFTGCGDELANQL